MTSKGLLVELLVEELPPKVLKTLGESFATGLVESLREQGLTSEHSAVTAFSTPRRLAAHISAVRDQADNRAVSQKLMPIGVGLDAQGKATAALLKKFASLGIEASALPQVTRQVEGKAEMLYVERVLPGITLLDGLQKALDEALTKLPIPKVMQYQLADGWTSVNFVRPARSLVALWGADIVAVQALGLKAGRQTQGHRFEAAMRPVVLQDADHYERQMKEQGEVIVRFFDRHGEISRQLNAIASLEGLSPVDDVALLDEVTALVERPQVLMCQFEPEFLDVPHECLILAMKAHQKYFPLLDPAGKLANKFLVVSNIKPPDASRVVEGNERVVRPRFADAKFFFDQDRKRALASRVPDLDKVVYHGKLGTLGERVNRVQRIAKATGQKLGGAILANQASRAALLAKADLLTDMVGEFPELQGTMGRYYALHDGESDEVADAISDHYKPRFAGDSLPRSMAGVVLALADKMETLVGLFGIGQTPTGDKDPFALRRHTLGVIRLVVERDLPFSLVDLIEIARDEMPQQARGDCSALSEFFISRARGYFEDKGGDPTAIWSVLRPMGSATQFSLLPPIVEAASNFIGTAEGQVLAQANKRITNILKKSGFEIEMGLSPRVLKKRPDESLFQQHEERSLYTALRSVGEDALRLREAGQFAESLTSLVPLSQPVQAFFDKVMVNVQDTRLRDNRVTLLQHARAYMNQVADLSLMAS